MEIMTGLMTMPPPMPTIPATTPNTPVATSSRVRSLPDRDMLDPGPAPMQLQPRSSSTPLRARASLATHPTLSNGHQDLPLHVYVVGAIKGPRIA